MNTVVFLHGWCGSPEIWDAQVAALSGQYRTLAPQLPHSVTTVDGFADWVAGLIENSAVICGHSMGGVIAARVAARHPERVAGIVTVDAPNFRLPIHPEIAARVQAFARPDKIGHSARHAFIESLFGPATPQSIKERIHAMAAREDPGYAAATWKGLIDPELWTGEMITPLPACVILAAGRKIDDAAIRRLYPQSQVHRVEGSHFLMMECPGEVNRILGSFLEQIR